mmetsp:Transcript_19927/g.41771  ORF Transcript_19927/g.41771 Transcript_19927/m.41771 type:complete len:464 (-) Transcript_19927:255-1646(-)
MCCRAGVPTTCAAGRRSTEQDTRASRARAGARGLAARNETEEFTDKFSAIISARGLAARGDCPPAAGQRAALARFRGPRRGAGTCREPGAPPADRPAGLGPLRQHGRTAAPRIASAAARRGGRSCPGLAPVELGPHPAGLHRHALAAHSRGSQPGRTARAGRGPAPTVHRLGPAGHRWFAVALESGPRPAPLQSHPHACWRRARHPRRAAADGGGQGQSGSGACRRRRVGGGCGRFAGRMSNGAGRAITSKLQAIAGRWGCGRFAGRGPGLGRRSAARPARPRGGEFDRRGQHRGTGRAVWAGPGLRCRRRARWIRSVGGRGWWSRRTGRLSGGPFSAVRRTRQRGGGAQDGAEPWPGAALVVELGRRCWRAGATGGPGLPGVRPGHSRGPGRQPQGDAGHGGSQCGSRPGLARRSALRIRRQGGRGRAGAQHAEPEARARRWGAGGVGGGGGGGRGGGAPVR